MRDLLLAFLFLQVDHPKAFNAAIVDYFYGYALLLAGIKGSDTVPRYASGVFPGTKMTLAGGCGEIVSRQLPRRLMAT
jgi:hypothetical protein